VEAHRKDLAPCEAFNAGLDGDGLLYNIRQTVGDRDSAAVVDSKQSQVICKLLVDGLVPCPPCPIASKLVAAEEKSCVVGSLWLAWWLVASLGLPVWGLSLLVICLSRLQGGRKTTPKQQRNHHNEPDDQDTPGGEPFLQHP
jgi:hypothetical protein